MATNQAGERASRAAVVSVLGEKLNRDYTFSTCVALHFVDAQVTGWGHLNHIEMPFNFGQNYLLFWHIYPTVPGGGKSSVHAYHQFYLTTQKTTKLNE